jgi:radical SAM protein with 4Fe4S-binding SPASM domain
MNDTVKENFQWSTRINQEHVDDLFVRRFGESYNEYRRIWNKSGPDNLPEFPVHLDIETIDACNLRCTHCFRHDDLKKSLGMENVNSGGRFPLEKLAKILDEGKCWGLNSVNFGFSGECAVNVDFIKMIEYADAADVIDIRSITNGLPLNEEKIEAIVESPIRIFSFSVDAGTAESYQKLKGVDGFDKLVRLVKHAYAYKKKLNRDFPLIRVSYYPSPETAGEEKLFISIFRDYVDFIDIQEFKDVRHLGNHELRTDCKMPFRRLAIFADGRVAPCCSLYSNNLIVGNINEQSLKEIWDGDEINALREELIEGNLRPVCEACLKSVGSVED